LTIDRTISIPIEQIREHPDDPRYSVGDVQVLADSIAEIGLLEPVLVTSQTTSEEFNATPYTVLSGHRRVAAMRLLGHKQIPIRVAFNAKTAADVDRIAELRVIMAGNTNRKQLTTLEEARGYQTMLDLGLKATDVAKVAGTKKVHVEGLAGAAKALGADHVAELADVQLTVEEMEGLARHADSKKRYKELVATVGKHDFAWKLRTADGAKEKAEVKAAATAMIKVPRCADYFGSDKTQPIGLTANFRRCRRQLSRQYHETHGRQRRAERGRAAIT
jgi:ParB/RepB/Spo0J family partition protein